MQTNRAVSSAGAVNFSTNTNIPIVFFGNDDGVGPNIVLNGGDTIHVAEGGWDKDPGIYTARDLAENTSFVSSVQSTGSVNADVPRSYPLTYTVSDNSGNQSVKTRTVVIDPSAFTSWAGGASTLATMTPEQLAKYAIGGASSLTANDGQAPVVGGDANTLTLTALLRNDGSLTFSGEASSDLAANWDSTVVSETDLTGAPTGFIKRQYSVDRGTDPKKFLRIRVTK
jgi:hypothetical protein